jgi:hypothetical protein
MGDPSWVSCQLQWHDARLKRKGTKELEGRGTAKLLEGAATASAFEAYVEHILFPGLHPGQQLIEDKGWQLLFLPAYSPDFSPSEETFSKVKAFLRRTGARTREPCKSDRASFTHRDFPRCSGGVQALRLRLT